MPQTNPDSLVIENRTEDQQSTNHSCGGQQRLEYLQKKPKKDLKDVKRLIRSH